MGLGLLGWCVLCSAGCRKPAEPERPVPTASVHAAASTVAPESASPRPAGVVDLPELAPPPETEQAEPPAAPQPATAGNALDEEPPPSRLLETDSGSWERPDNKPVRGLLADEDRIFLHDAAEAARAGNASISASKPVEEVIIASGTVDGRVKRVRPGTLEVSDDEGNIYELRIDGRSRGLRRGRHIPLRRITEGMPVRASFDLVGGGESLARDIELRR